MTTKSDAAPWTPARLIPTSGIGGAREQEVRATSALLSVISAVPEFARALLSNRFGAPAGNVTCYTEVPFKLKGKEFRPDGLIRLTRGKRVWTALVEVKTGRNLLKKEQVESYLEIAKDQSFDAVITISNEFSPIAGEHPLPVNRRLVQKVELHHLSWIGVLSEAVVQHEHRGVNDPDQAWLLKELIAYLEHPNSGAMEFDDMGPSWVKVRNSARNGTLRGGDPEASELVARWEEFVRYLCLQLGMNLGADVQQVLSRRARSDIKIRRSEELKILDENGILATVLRVPDAIGDISVEVNLKTQKIEVAVEIDAPRTGRALTRLNWILRQLPEAVVDLRLEASFENVRSTTSNMVVNLREDPQVALLDGNRRLPKGFTVALVQDMGIKRGNGIGSFVESVRSSLENFYRLVVQNLKPWTPPAPKLQTVREDMAESDEIIGSPE